MSPEEIRQLARPLNNLGAYDDDEAMQRVYLVQVQALIEIAAQLAVQNEPKLRTEQIRGEQFVARTVMGILKEVAALRVSDGGQLMALIFDKLRASGVDGGQ